MSAESLINAVEDEYGVAYSRDGKRLVKCRNEKLTQYIVKARTKVICDRAFRECNSLTLIKLPNGLTSIGDGAFCECGLTSIKIPDSVTAIGSNAFYGCENLTSIEFPDGLTSIGDCAFWRCKKLTSIELPEGVTLIGDCAFAICDRLEKVYIRCSDRADEAAVIAKFKELLSKELHKKIEVVTD